MTQPHNQCAAQAWGLAGADYDFISFGLSDALSHAVQALWPVPGQRILDIATGTGWTARLAAGTGAEVTAVDIAEGLLEAARGLSAHLPNLEFQVADAEALPFGDASFDGVISTYGVIFARPQPVATELARVTRPGGRLVLLTWFDDPEDYIPAFFAMVGRHSDGPPPENSPLLWGDPDWVQALLGEAFEVTAEEHVTTLFAPDADTLWRKYLKGFGPMRLAAEAQDPAGLEAFREAFRVLHAPYDTGRGLRIPRKAMLAQGTRRPA